MLEVRYARALETNFVWLLCDPEDRCAIVDPGESQPVMDVMQAQQLKPAAILITHHHPDHVNGAAALQDRFGIPIFGPDDERVPGDATCMSEGETLELASLDMAFDVIFIPGHTRSHIAFYGEGILLSGDTLFSIGCGRLFEGSAEQMTASLGRLAALPSQTQIYCGHEYTLANCDFARQVEPGNEALHRHETRARERLQRGQPSLPSTLGEERAANPFLRTSESTVVAAAERWAGRKLGSQAEVFGALRAWKDRA